MSKETSLHTINNIYTLLYKLKFIDSIPTDMNIIYNDLVILNNLHNFTIRLLSKKNYTIEKKRRLLKNIEIFSNNQIQTILNYTINKNLNQIGGGIDYDWIFFPLYKLETHPKYGIYFGVPIDFISVLLSGLDSIIETLVRTIDTMRDPIVQTIMSVFSVGTAGIGLAITPVLVPVVNKTVDIIIHIITHLIDILNMFIHVSRKNFGLAYLLLLEIIPPFNLVMDKLTNYTVILNRSLNRGQKFLNLATKFMSENIIEKN